MMEPEVWNSIDSTFNVGRFKHFKVDVSFASCFYGLFQDH